MILRNATIENDIVRVWVETDDKQLIMLKLGTAKDLKIEDVRELDEKVIFEKVQIVIDNQIQAEKEAIYAEEQKRLEEVKAELAILTDATALDAKVDALVEEKIILEAKEKPIEPPILPPEEPIK